MNAGDLPGQTAARPPAGVRAAIVAEKPGNAGGAKGGRKAYVSPERVREEQPPSVPATDRQGGEDPWRRHGAERGVWTERMLAALDEGVKGGKWFSLIDKVGAERTLALAWEKVRSNGGSPGADGITVERFGRECPARLERLRGLLRTGAYRPRPVRRAWIPKPGSPEKRPLGIPTVTDRVAQTAVRMVIEPIFEREFAPDSYGFRPGRSCRDALRRVEALLKAGRTHVVDIDIRGYFDAIPHDRLMGLVRRRVADGKVLGVIEGFLKAGVLEGTEAVEPEEGTPQGGAISPLLANIYLDPLDWLMREAGFDMVRYADDMVVLCPDRASAERALVRIRGWMAEAGLELHPEKTQVVDMAQARSHFDFLGYRFWRGKGGALRRLIRPKSARKLRARLKPATKRANGHSLDALVRKLNPVLRGFYGYFKHAEGHALRGVDQWVRGRLRSILRKRRGGRGRGRGQDHHRWPNAFFTGLGLFSLEQARTSEIASLRGGATC